MRILIVLGSITPNDDANSNVAKLIASELAGMGHEVTMLGMAFQKCSISETINGIDYHRILFYDSPEQVEFDSEYKKMHSVFEKFSFPFSHLRWFANRMRKHLVARFGDPKERRYKKELQYLVKAKKIQRVIVITSPFYIAKAYMKTKLDVPVVWYQLDPNQSNKTAIYKRKKGLLEDEKRWYRRIEYAVIPRLVYQENQKNGLKEFLPKMKPSEFPNVRKIEYMPTTDDISFDSSNINLVFAGTFYEDIRNPEPLFQAIARMSDKRIKLHIIGGGCEDIIQQWTDKCEAIVFHGYRSLQAAMNAMLKADFLVNVDNSAVNMLPSKINDYISTGNPIINFHPFWESECTRYLKRYALFYDVCTIAERLDESVIGLENFCINNKGCKVAFSEIKEIYKESTPEFVTELLLGD